MELKYKKRLLKLADFLETKVPNKSFDLFHFVSTDNGWSDKELKANLKASKCGTVACAVGWCPIIFPKHWIFNKEESTYDGYVRLKNSTLSEFKAAEMFFGIHCWESSDLFDPSGYPDQPKGPTAKQVAKKIRNLVAAKEEGKSECRMTKF